jgi:hypothetical protein
MVPNTIRCSPTYQRTKQVARTRVKESFRHANLSRAQRVEYWATVSVTLIPRDSTLTVKHEVEREIWVSTCRKGAGSTTKPVYLVLAQNAEETAAISCWLIVHSGSHCGCRTDKTNNALQNSFKLWYLNFRFVTLCYCTNKCSWIPITRHYEVVTDSMETLRRIYTYNAVSLPC